MANINANAIAAANAAFAAAQLQAAQDHAAAMAAALPANGGANGNGVAPPANGNGGIPPAIGNGGVPPANGNGGVPPAIGNGVVPPVNANPPAMGSGIVPQAVIVHNAPFGANNIVLLDQDWHLLTEDTFNVCIDPEGAVTCTPWPGFAVRVDPNTQVKHVINFKNCPRFDNVACANCLNTFSPGMEAKNLPTAFCANNRGTKTEPRRCTFHLCYSCSNNETVVNTFFRPCSEDQDGRTPRDARVGDEVTRYQATRTTWSEHLPFFPQHRPQRRPSHHPALPHCA